MVKINFTVPNAREMILSGRKVTTMRQLSPKKEEQLKRIRKVQLYEGSWRLGNQVKIADAKVVYVRLMPQPLSWIIDTLSDDLLYSEGFETREEMRDFFVKQYGPDILYECTFSMIGFHVIDAAAGDL